MFVVVPIGISGVVCRMPKMLKSVRTAHTDPQNVQRDMTSGDDDDDEGSAAVMTNEKENSVSTK